MCKDREKHQDSGCATVLDSKNDRGLQGENLQEKTKKGKERLCDEHLEKHN